MVMKFKAKKAKNKRVDEKLDRADRVVSLSEKIAKVGFLLANIIEKVFGWFQ